MRNGQLPWGLVIAIVFAAASLQIIDYFWRITVLPFHAFALWAAAGELAAAVLLFGAYVLIRRRTVADMHGGRP